MSGSISFLGARVSSIIDLVRMIILLSLALSFNHTLFLLSFFLSMTKYFILPNQLLSIVAAKGDRGCRRREVDPGWPGPCPREIGDNEESAKG